jgi:Tfp pilus assembly protein PilO
MTLKQEEIAQFTSEIKANQNKIKKLTPQFKNFSTLFHTKSEVEGLYQSLSHFAGANGLVISKIQKRKPAAVSKATALGKKEKKKSKKKEFKNIAYYTIPVDFEIKGNFLGYIKFKRAISLSNKMLNFDEESIKVVKGNATGTINVSGTLTIVGLADEFF